MGALCQLHTFVLAGFVLCPIIILNAIINAFRCCFGMQLPIISVFIFTLKIVNTVGYIARLLYFSQESARSYRVNAPCRQIKDIALAHSTFAQCVGNGVVFHHRLVFFGRNSTF